METIKISEKRTFANTIGAGLKSTFSGKGNTYYVLEFKTNSSLHRSGSTKQIIIDYAEIGRSPKCQVRFGEDCTTVSSVHAAIVKDGDDYFIKHLSKTNPTLVNGKPVAQKWYLKPGDEIQLAYEGPVMGFLVPQNNKTSTIPLTQRLNLFRQQALRPYKQALSLIGLLLLITILGFGFYAYKSQQDIGLLTNKNVLNEQEITRIRLQNDSSSKVINELKQRVKNIKPVTNVVYKNPPAAQNASPNDVKSLHPGVYLIGAEKVELTIDGTTNEIEGNWMGTGFLMEDGKFITARHIAEPWLFIKEKDDPRLDWNLIASNGGKVVAHFIAVSSNGEVFKFTSEDFTSNKANDKTVDHETDEGVFLLNIASSSADWSYVNTGKNGILQYGNQSISKLNAGDKLICLGFPFGLGIDAKGVEPMYSENVLSRAGVHNGVLNTSGRSFDKGNSGGPVFSNIDGTLKVVGLVSAYLGAQGFIIPITSIK